MHIKQNIDLMQFLSAVSLCEFEVFFETPEGDSLALHSELCRYIFCSLSNRPELLQNGSIRFENQNDQQILEDYLELE